MNDITQYLLSLLVGVFIYWTDRIFPRWFGLVYNVLFLLFIGYLMIFKGEGQMGNLWLVLFLGEAAFIGIWGWAREDRKKKMEREMDKMKAKDASKNKKV